MVNYLGRYIGNLASSIKPLNDLLHNVAHWFWGPEQHSAFQKSKNFCLPPQCCVFMIHQNKLKSNRERVSCCHMGMKFSQYLAGLDSFELQTDHKPLVPLV
jgi:hypothetical protein